MCNGGGVGVVTCKRGCVGVGSWAWLRVGVGCRGRSVGMVTCGRRIQGWGRGCAAVAAVGGRVQAVCCS